MFWTIMFLIFGIISLILPKVLLKKKFPNKFEKRNEENGELEEIIPSGKIKTIIYSFRILGLLFFITMILSTFILVVPNNKYAQFNKRILGNSLSNGQIVAINGEMGPQGWIKREGFHLIPFVDFIYNVEFKPIIEVPEGKVLTLVAKDGVPLGENEYFAPEWYESINDAVKNKLDWTTKTKNIPTDRGDIEKRMLEPEFFLTHGGKKGPQVNVLKPGKYPINTYLWSYGLQNATKIDTGFVGVVTSKVGKIFKEIKRTTENTSNEDGIAVPLVDKGYIGVQKETLTPGNYYLNPKAYEVLPQDMRAQTWYYSGGYTPREAVINVTADNEIVYENIKHKLLPIPKKAADMAIEVKTKDKYPVYIELRLQIQPDPAHASQIVAGIGSLAMVEDKVITPAVRAVLRNLGEKYDAIDFVDKRSQIEEEFRKLIKDKTLQAGVPAKEVFFGNIDLPSAVLLPQQVEELSLKMEKAYVQKEKTFKQLTKTNETKATADQQSELVKAKINKQKAEYQKETRKILGEGERLYMEEIAKGQEAQKKVLGEEKTYALQMWKETTALVKEVPELATAIPQVYINKTGGGEDGSGFDEGAAIMSLQQLKKAQENITNIKK